MNEIEQSNDNLAAYWVQAQPIVLAFVASVIPDFHEVDDILQSVALVTTRRFHEYDRKYSFSAWAIGIAKNEILNTYRRQGKQPVLLEESVINCFANTCENKPTAWYDKRIDMERALSKCIQHLDTRWRQIMEMHYLRELSATRIAQQLGMTSGRVRVTLHRIRGMLRDCVDRRMQEG